MVTPEDMKANAEFIHMADHHVDVPGGTNNHNLANVDLIVDIAKRMQVQVGLVWYDMIWSLHIKIMPDLWKFDALSGWFPEVPYSLLIDILHRCNP